MLYEAKKAQKNVDQEINYVGNQVFINRYINYFTLDYFN